MIKVELECQLEEWKAREALRGQNTGLIKIPNNVSANIAVKCLPKEDKKYNPNESPYFLPMSWTRPFLAAINPQKEVLKIFHLWNSVRHLLFLHSNF